MLTLSRRLQKNQIVFCGDINIPKTNWNTFHSEDDFEREVLDLIDKHCLQEALTIPTCGKNTLDLALTETSQYYAKKIILLKNCTIYQTIILLP